MKTNEVFSFILKYSLCTNVILRALCMCLYDIQSQSSFFCNSDVGEARDYSGLSIQEITSVLNVSVM